MTVTELTVETFKEMCAKHMSYAEIGRATGKSKNAISGWAQRNGLSKPENTPIKRAKREAVTKSQQPRGAPVRRGPLVKCRAGAPSPFKTCQWISGEPSSNDSCKCGEPVADKRPYCEPHLRRAWVPGTAYKSQRKDKAGSGNFEFKQAGF